ARRAAATEPSRTTRTNRHGIIAAPPRESARAAPLPWQAARPGARAGTRPAPLRAGTPRASPDRAPPATSPRARPCPGTPSGQARSPDREHLRERLGRKLAIGLAPAANVEPLLAILESVVDLVRDHVPQERPREILANVYALGPRSVEPGRQRAVEPQ